ncbi:Hypothetical predicted protein [Octopus vulgaris]|uniref:Uncharacterized protein n=1 Tax=Octopus vulgaris TaxID=6645 RepID=A0AA36B1C1_OCTVU|nr:Hypothetical predicted protein [Octopus vulgaris]
MANNSCMFSYENLQKMSEKLADPKSLFRVSIQLGLDFLAIKTMEEFFLCSDKVRLIPVFAFAAFIDTRGKRSDKSILDEIKERLEPCVKNEKEETSIGHLLEKWETWESMANINVHDHRIREKTFCQWELYEDPFQITNEMILHIGELFEKNNFPPQDVARWLGIPYYFYIIDHKYPCPESDEKQGIVDRFDWRKRLEVLFKGRENHHTDGMNFLKALKLTTITPKNLKKSNIRIRDINKKYREHEIWKDSIGNSAER